LVAFIAGNTKGFQVSANSESARTRKAIWSMNS
jgi:hypothetical protein